MFKLTIEEQFGTDSPLIKTQEAQAVNLTELLELLNLIGLPIRIPASYIVSNSRIRTITQCNAEVNETQHSCGEVKQITHKGIKQLTILRF